MRACSSSPRQPLCRARDPSLVGERECSPQTGFVLVRSFPQDISTLMRLLATIPLALEHRTGSGASTDVRRSRSEGFDQPDRMSDLGTPPSAPTGRNESKAGAAPPPRAPTNNGGTPGDPLERPGPAAPAPGAPAVQTGFAPGPKDLSLKGARATQGSRCDILRERKKAGWGLRCDSAGASLLPAYH